MFNLYFDTLIPTLLDSEGAINVLILQRCVFFRPYWYTKKKKKKTFKILKH